MREILFRGKRIDNGEWVYGGYYVIPDGEGGAIHRIAVSDCERFEYNDVVVDPSSISEFTGLTDKYNAIIFEDDIIRANHDGAVGVIRFGEYMSPSDPGNTRHTGYYVDWQGKEKDFLRADLGYWANRRDVEVIGNIHDNPELLEDKP